MKDDRIAKNTLIGSISSMVMTAISFLQHILFASIFGVSQILDVFLLVNSFPELCKTVISGSVGGALIPVFAKYSLGANKNETKEFLSIVINLILIILIVLLMLGLFFAPGIIRVIGPSLKGNMFYLAIRIFRLALFTVTIFGLKRILDSVFESGQEFFWPALTNIFIAFVGIGVFLLLVERLGIISLIWGILAGLVFSIVILILKLKRKGINYYFCFRFQHPGVKTILFLMAPLVVTSSISRLNIFTDRIIAARFLPEGSISILNFASRLVLFPHLLIGLPIALAVFPALAKYSAQDNLPVFTDKLLSGIRMVLFLTIPIAVGVVVLRLPLVRLLFEHGKFSPQDTYATTSTLLCYSVILVSGGIGGMLVRAHYALRNTVLPMRWGLTEVGLNIILDLILVRFFGYLGIAMATSITAIIGLWCLSSPLRRKLAGFDIRRFSRAITSFLFCATVMGLGCYISASILGHLLNISLIRNQFLHLGASIIIGVLIYLILAFSLKIEEANTIKRFLLERIVGR